MKTVRLILLTVLTTLWLILPAQAQLDIPAESQTHNPDIKVQTGTIEGALYTIAKPENWTGDLLLVAHGLRKDTMPLSARLDLQNQLFSHLLEKGWMVAASSYRRNGLIILDAIEDLNSLMHHIQHEFGKPKRTLIMGSSMGGAIGTLIAETQVEAYDGVLAIGAALSARGPKEPFEFGYKPHIPILFLSNQSEIQGPRNYLQKAADAPVVPAVWIVNRDGHVNVNDDERKSALEALNQFIETGQIARDHNGTITGHLVSNASFSDGKAFSLISSISEVHGNIFSEFVAEDLQQIGISQGDHFQLGLGDYTVQVLWGSTYSDVSQGQWVAYITGDNSLMIARNFENACVTLNCKSGDQLVLTPVNEEEEK